MKFDDYAFSAEIKSGIQKANFTECTPVQEKTFNYVLEGRDVYAQSQTGTGKTAAFLISIFHLLQTEKHLNSKALIVVPTRELAVQIKDEADILGQDLNFKAGCFYGGTSYKAQESLLENGVDIVIATPGRLLDFSKQGKIKFSEFSILVVDEADRLFDMGFVDDIRKIFNATKNVKDKVTLLFSATMNPSVGNISWEYMKNPGEIFIEAEQLTVEAIKQELYHVGKDEKMSILLGLLNRENPDSAIIFTNTKHMAHEISKRLDHNGYKNEYLMGDLPQKKRLSIVNSVKEGKVKFLVATDVAARGLHVDDLSLVINYDLPLDSENYVHRIGRTARAGKNGKAITLACENYVYSLSGIEDYIDSKIPVFPTTEDLFLEDTSSHLRFSLNEYKNRGKDNRNNDNRNRDNRNRDNKKEMLETVITLIKNVIMRLKKSD
ncbi:DEAD/DEAH box helicase [Thiospirochaeta perfilievii]|uniref:DEAD/DEAH box helicase n=1 Tax=Thiospirochaeta perfilievii TaxID=252967 RepID=A0A5C1Q6X4_9SPIO|nr:DEAD/DEAH box helicase [Thiospirochaeta perfilievii]QEN03813.1 DEAD/DEAH box helicase [Thiospirochaeta perfilievii]